VLNVEKNVKFHSNPTRAGQFIAGNVTPKNDLQDHQDDISYSPTIKFPIIHYFFKGFVLFGHWHGFSANKS